MVTFRIPDMTCGHCAATISRAIASEDAGARLDFDLPAHVLRVTPATATPAELEAAIREAGYTPAAVDAAPRARARGCGCGCGPARPVDISQVRGASGSTCCA
ncbi:heavy-metal-associated domain-containing protein [Ramlibacter sp.]|uniref:heavy-metal-associated domain-containing protein n=1 Tax=Ramlibacter sp. TaxID=1917967 RepID=UPI0035B2398D